MLEARKTERKILIMDQYNYNITIIIPVYNCEKYISRCMDSIINQNYNSVEIIIINDGSTDNTLEKCKKYDENYKNIRIINQTNRGVCYSRNIGIKNAQGKYILFIDADDYLLENSLNNIDELLESEFDIIKFSYIIKNKKSEQKIIFEEKTYDFNIDNKEIFFRKFLENSHENMVWGQLIKRSLLNNITFKENLFYAEDFLFNYELYNQAKNIKYTEKIIYNYEKNDDSITMNFKNKKILKKIDNLIYVFEKLILENEITSIRKYLEVKFLKEVIPQIMMLVFENGIPKKHIIQQYRNILEKDLFTSIFSNIEITNLKNYKYKSTYRYMKEKKLNLLYIVSKMYKILKQLQFILVNIKDR